MGASHPPLPLAADGGSDVVDSLSPTNQSPSDVPRYVFRWRLELLFASPTKRLVPAFVVGALIASVGFVVSIAAVVLQLVFPPSSMSPLAIEQVSTPPLRKRARGSTTSPPQSPPRPRRAATSFPLTPATSASSGSQAGQAVEGSGAALGTAIGNSNTGRSRFRSAPTTKLEQDYFYQGQGNDDSRRPTRIGTICQNNNACCSPHASSSKTAFSDESASANHSACSLIASSACGSLPDNSSGGSKHERGRVGGLKRIRAAFTRRPSSRVAGAGACETDGTCSEDHHDEDLPVRRGGHARTPSLLSDEGNRVSPAPAPLPELHLPTPSPTDSQPSSPAQALGPTLFEEPVQTPSSVSLSPSPPSTSKPHTTFHVPNILRRPSSPARSRTLSTPALKRTPTNKSSVATSSSNGSSTSSGGLCPKHRQRKPKPPPLRTAYTYTFAPSPQPDLDPEEGDEFAEGEGSGEDVGPRDETRPPTASSRRPAFVSMQTMPIFTPLKPRVAGTLPLGIFHPGSTPTPTTAGSNYSMATGPSCSTNTSMSSASRLGSGLARRANSMKRRSTGLVELNEEGVSEFGERVTPSTAASKRRSMPPRPSADMLMSTSDVLHGRASSEGRVPHPHPLAESVLMAAEAGETGSGSETATAAATAQEIKKKNRRFSLR